MFQSHQRDETANVTFLSGMGERRPCTLNVNKQERKFYGSTSKHVGTMLGVNEHSFGHFLILIKKEKTIQSTENTACKDMALQHFKSVTSFKLYHSMVL